jgi:DNA-binding MarR family transcriptional regulator
MGEYHGPLGSNEIEGNASAHPGAEELTPQAAEITAAMNAVRRIVRALRLSSRASEKALGVSTAQLFVLQQLAEAAARSSAPSIAQLATLTATDPSSVSVVVSRLAQRGLCARRASKADARRAEVTITPAGRALLQEAPQPVQSRMLDALAQMASERRIELVAGLEEIVHALGMADHAPVMFFEDEHDRTGSERPHGDNGDLAAHDR